MSSSKTATHHGEPGGECSRNPRNILLVWQHTQTAHRKKQQLNYTDYPMTAANVPMGFSNTNVNDCYICKSRGKM